MDSNRASKPAHSTGKSFEIPKTCKAGVVNNEGPDFYVTVEEVPVPLPGPGELLIKLNVTGICFSDLHYMMNDMQGMAKMSSYGVRSPGHEGAGVVVQLGPGVQGWKVGDRAGIKPVYDVCHSCELCWDDKEAFCDAVRFTGLEVPGTYQQYVISPARYTTPIPDGVADFLAAPIMCSGTTVLRSIKESGLKPGQFAVFPGGGGGVGVLGIQLALARGLRPIAIDTGEKKRELCLKMGAEKFFDFRESSNVQADVIKYCEGIGPHAIFVTAPAAYREVHKLCGKRVGARIMCIGLPEAGTVLVEADPSQFIFRNLSMTGTLVGNMLDTAHALDYAKRGTIKPCFETFSIDDLPKAVEKLRTGQITGRAVVDFNS